MSKVGELHSENIRSDRTKTGNEIYKGSKMKKVRIGDKLVEVEDGVIKATAEEIHRSGGRVDVIVKVPCLQIVGKSQKG